MIVWINSHESAARVRIYSNNHEWFIINIWKIVNSYLVFVFSTTREWWLMAQRCIYLLSVVFILNTTLRARINIKYNCENPPSVVLCKQLIQWFCLSVMTHAKWCPIYLLEGENQQWEKQSCQGDYG